MDGTSLSPVCASPIGIGIGIGLVVQFEIYSTKRLVVQLLLQRLMEPTIIRRKKTHCSIFVNSSELYFLWRIYFGVIWYTN